jgi:hypothetical protein
MVFRQIPAIEKMTEKTLLTIYFCSVPCPVWPIELGLNGGKAYPKFLGKLLIRKTIFHPDARQRLLFNTELLLIHFSRYDRIVDKGCSTILG